MKKQFLMMIVCCAVFQLFASRVGGESESLLDPNSYTKTVKKSGGTLITYNGDLYDLQTQEFLGVDEEGYFRTAYEYIMDGEAQLFLSRTLTDLICVDAKPTSVEELSACVWVVQESIVRQRNHHVPAGGKTISQWQIKEGFNIFHYNYTLTIERIFGLESGQEKEMTSFIKGKSFGRTGQLTGKKGKNTWYNDPTGQGSNGLEPQTELEREAVFRSLFSEYAFMI